MTAVRPDASFRMMDTLAEDSKEWSRLRWAARDVASRLRYTLEEVTRQNNPKDADLAGLLLARAIGYEADAAAYTAEADAADALREDCAERLRAVFEAEHPDLPQEMERPEGGWMAGSGAKYARANELRRIAYDGRRNAARRQEAADEAAVLWEEARALEAKERAVQNAADEARWARRAAWTAWERAARMVEAGEMPDRPTALTFIALEALGAGK